MAELHDPVAAHYQAEPYPPRNPDDEHHRLITGSPSHLDEIVHYLRAGHFDRGAPFRALIAGGGTGDAAIMLAQQLTDRGARGEVVCLDPSDRSLAIAAKRAQVRGLRNLVCRRGSLLDLAADRDGPFDYIDCCGVLHHLPDPAAGLSALTAVLSADGGMGLMVYAPLGRTGVYPIRQALAALLPGDAPMAERLALARSLVTDLPARHWLKQNPFLATTLEDPSALADLLLVPIDRTYTAAEFTGLVQGAGLNLLAWIEPARYDPLTYLSDPALRERAAELDPLAAAALAEELSGAMKTHVAYVSRCSVIDALARPAAGMRPIIHRVARQALAESLAKRSSVRANFDGFAYEATLPAWAAEAVRLCDGEHSITTILTAVGERDFAPLYRPLNALNLLLLRTA